MIRSLAFPSTAGSSGLPIMLSEPIHSQARRALAPDGKALAVMHSGVEVRIRRYKTRREMGLLYFFNRELSRTGARTMAWSADSKALGFAGSKWAGVWLPFEERPVFYGISLRASVEIGPLAVLSDSLQIIYAQGQGLAALEIPRVPILTEWQALMSGVPEGTADSTFKAPNDWEWNHTQWGYEGVHTREGRLVWYAHSHNPHAGGGAAVQEFSSFLENGPSVSWKEGVIPEEILVQVYQAVWQLV
jgi:hypothetical protein